MNLSESSGVGEQHGSPAVGRRTPVARLASVILSTLAAGLLIASLGLPLWQMRMEAPQYRDEEALRVTIYPGSMQGDLGEITVLNQHIGVHLPTALPQLKWLPGALVTGGLLGVLASCLPRAAQKLALAGVASGLALSLLAAAVQAQWQMYDVGHKREEKTALVGVKDFTLPLLGHAKLAQFNINSRLGAGAYFVGTALALQFGAAWLNGRRNRERGCVRENAAGFLGNAEKSAASSPTQLRPAEGTIPPMPTTPVRPS